MNHPTWKAWAWRIALYSTVALLCALAFALTVSPRFIIQMANVVWSCF